MMSRAAVAALLCATLAACGGEKKVEFAYDTNLLVNGSFEEVGRSGVPVGWNILPFRGLEGQQEVTMGVDESEVQDGKRSYKFLADPGTRKFYALGQEVHLPEGVSHVRLQGWMQLDQVERKTDQYAQCNFLLTFFDADHVRFQELRFADKRSRLRFNSQVWSKEDLVFRVPKGTRYVMVSCILGMNGTVWFDNVSLSVPTPIQWETAESPNFVFHWMKDHPFPDGAMESQQQLFNYFENRLGIDSHVVINYYLYPDTATIRDVLSLKGYQYVSWDDREFHSINPNDNHEIIHFMTDEYGKPPRSIAEGTVFWLQDNWQGYPVHKVAAVRLRQQLLPTVAQLTSYNDFALLDVGISMPCIASFVGFLAERFGVGKLLELYSAINGLNNYVPVAAAMEKVYGIPAEDLERMWVEMLKRVDISDIPAWDPPDTPGH